MNIYNKAELINLLTLMPYVSYRETGMFLLTLWRFGKPDIKVNLKLHLKDYLAEGGGKGKERRKKGMGSLENEIKNKQK